MSASREQGTCSVAEEPPLSTRESIICSQHSDGQRPDVCQYKGQQMAFPYDEYIYRLGLASGSFDGCKFLDSVLGTVIHTIEVNSRDLLVKLRMVLRRILITVGTGSRSPLLPPWG